MDGRDAELRSGFGFRNGHQISKIVLFPEGRKWLRAVATNEAAVGRDLVQVIEHVLRRYKDAPEELPSGDARDYDDDPFDDSLGGSEGHR